MNFEILVVGFCSEDGTRLIQKINGEKVTNTGKGTVLYKLVPNSDLVSIHFITTYKNGEVGTSTINLGHITQSDILEGRMKV